MLIITPPWLTLLPNNSEAHRLSRNRYLMRSIALLHTPQGDLSELARSLEVSKQALSHAWNPSKGFISAAMAARIEELMGSDVVTAAELRLGPIVNGQ